MGLELRAKGEAYRNYFVSKILDGSPADLSGLEEGDEVLFVNNRSTKELTISEVYKNASERRRQ